MSASSFIRAAALVFVGVVVGALLLPQLPVVARSTCPSGMGRVGKLCVDRYEASVWSKPTGGHQYGVTSADYPCNVNGQDCKGKIFERSVKGVKPSRGISWFQAQAALANVGKRLLTNAEWQLAATGTPDAVASPGADDCVTDNIAVGQGADPTGTHSSCVSRFGMYDMVGNANEWVADWVPLSSQCLGWGSFSDDQMCLNGASTSASYAYPGALLRGGGYNYQVAAGVFAVSDDDPKGFDSSFQHGFRGAR
jgi:formylglycine-generating enzyme required for sulfatase activity